jgi:phage terminase large subunit-like protein
LDAGAYRRLVRRAILSIARKNGKTALIAALVLVHLIGPEAIPNGEIYSAANDRQQAAQVFKIAAQIVRADPDLMALLKVVDSTKTIACHRNGSFYQAVSSETGTKHGLNPSVIIYDELAQARSRDLYDVLDTAMGARLEPLFITISTQSNDPEHILSKLIDDGLNANDPTTVCHLYAVPEDCEDIFNSKVWRKANPALGDFRDLADFKALAAKAQRMPAEEPKFRNLYLNQRVAPVSSLISRAEWMACVGDARIEDGEPVYLGLDLSKRSDLTALAIVSADRGSRVDVRFWKPHDLLREHSRRDFGAGNLRYIAWQTDGFLETSPGRTVDYEVVALAIAEVSQRYDVLGLAFDRWRIDDLIKELDRIGLQSFVDEGKGGTGLRLVRWGQGFKDMGPAVDALEHAVMERKLKHPSNPVLNWNMRNAVAETDPAGNRKITKDEKKQRFRVDGAVALTMAMGLKARDRKDEPSGSVDDYLASLDVA